MARCRTCGSEAELSDEQNRTGWLRDSAGRLLRHGGERDRAEVLRRRDDEGRGPVGPDVERPSRYLSLIRRDEPELVGAPGPGGLHAIEEDMPRALRFVRKEPARVTCMQVGGLERGHSGGGRAHRAKGG